MRARDIISEETVQIKDLKAMIRAHPEVINHLHDPSEELVMYALKHYEYGDIADLLRSIKNPSPAILGAIIKNDPSAIEEIKNPSEELQLIAVKQDPHNIAYIKKPAAAVQLVAFKIDPSSLQNVKKIDPLVIKAVVEAGKSYLIPHAVQVSDPKEQIASLKANINNLNHFTEIGPQVLRYMLNTKRVSYFIDALLKSTPDAIEKAKVSVIKMILRQIKSPDEDYPYQYPNRRKFLVDVIDVLKARGCVWPELTVIRNSLKAMKPKALGENDV